MSFRNRMWGAAALGLAMPIGSGLAVPPAQAAYIVTLAQAGSNVVATGSGTIDTAGLSFFPHGSDEASINPSIALILTGPTTIEPDDIYTGFTGPASFGSGGSAGASSGSGDVVGISGYSGYLYAPFNYVSGSPLADSATYDNQSFSSLGVTPGSYVYSFGSGANADTFTVQIVAAPVPEPASLALLGTGLLGLALTARRRMNA